MWKVRNHRNDTELRRFEEAVIHPLWTLLRLAYTTGRSIDQLTSDAEPTLIAALSLRRKGATLCQILDLLVRETTNDVDLWVQAYESQAQAIRAGRAPVLLVTPPRLSDVFSKYLYEEGLTDPAIWDGIRGNTFTRKEFYENFQLDNPVVPACPYCDLDSINAVSNCNIEHFLPRSKFPFLSLNALNMFPSCHGCNGFWEGKGTHYSVEIPSLLNNQYGDDVAFNFDPTKARISLSSMSGNTHTLQFIDLMQLERRYGCSHVYAAVCRAGSVLFDTFTQNEFDPAEAQAYVSTVRAGAPMQFAICAYVYDMVTYLGSGTTAGAGRGHGEPG